MSMIEQSQLRMRYYAKAKQYLYDRDRLDTATEDELINVAEYLRHQDFLLATRPYLRQKEYIVTRFFNLQANPAQAKLPPELEAALAQWDEMIAIEARNFGYESP